MDAEIREKRNDVAKALAQHQANATKSGDLDGALAIRKLIESLSLQPSEKGRDAEGMVLQPPVKKLSEIEQALLNSIWDVEGKEGESHVEIGREISSARFFTPYAEDGTPITLVPNARGDQVTLTRILPNEKLEWILELSRDKQFLVMVQSGTKKLKLRNENESE